MSIIQITIRVAWSLAIAVVAGAILAILHVFDFYPERRLAFAMLGVIADPKLLEALQWAAVAAVAVVSAGLYNIVAWRLSKRTLVGQKSELKDVPSLEVIPLDGAKLIQGDPKSGREYLCEVGVTNHTSQSIDDVNLKIIEIEGESDFHAPQTLLKKHVAIHPTDTHNWPVARCKLYALGEALNVIIHISQHGQKYTTINPKCKMTFRAFGENTRSEPKAFFFGVDNENRPVFELWDSGKHESLINAATDANSYYQYIPLNEAASIAFDKLRDASGTINSLVLGTMMRIEKMDQSKIPRQVCQILFDDTKIPLHGIYPPSKVLREIPREHAESFMFSDDASELFDLYNPLERYHSVAVKKSDFEQRLKELT